MNTSTGLKKNRPIHLDLTTFRFPIMSYASILHRVSGFVLFFVIPMVLFAFQQSMSSQSSFEDLVACLSAPFSKLVIWLSLSALAYHLVAGIKHLVMDSGIGETLEGGQLAAKITLIVSGLLIICLGIWIW